ncbi:MAG: hypothetical protein AAF657_11945 [Acidobacteriota bacterium]
MSRPVATSLTVLLIAVWSITSSAALDAEQEEADRRIGTRADRQALFDELIAKTLAREAFSEIKNRRLGLNVEAAMRATEDDVVGAASESELFYALVRLSNARRDRHLRVRPVDGGLRIADYDLAASTNYPGLDLEGSGPPTAPIRFAVDYGAAPRRHVLFVGDLGEGVERWAAEAPLAVGDVVVAIQGEPTPTFMARIEPYHRHSTVNGFWVKAAEALNRKTPILPPAFYGDDLALTLEKASGRRYSVRLPYLPASAIAWQGHGVRSFPGFERIAEFGTFDLYRHTGGRDVLALAWRRFGGTLVEDIDALIDLASERGWLDHDLIWDGTRSRGGGRGAYALQRLSPRPFKTTFGNLRLSDTTLPFIELKRQQFEERQLSDGAPETIDDGTWLMGWLEGDVLKGLAAGQDYSNTVPFKTAHAPAWSDGILEPAERHFRGRMICLFGPYGGSHLDQFAAIVVDNGLCHTLGMPTGGYSNTWEWEEVVKFHDGQPVVEFMWSIGHTVRPNGEVLEGNPAEMDEHIPTTRENYLVYHDRLLSRALLLLGD